MAMSEMKVEVVIPADISLPEKDKENLKKEFTAAIRGVLDKHVATQGKNVGVALEWKAKP
jgi:hypothetical protein